MWEQPAGTNRRERKKRRTHHEIFEAALALFADRGFASTSVESICERADVARGTFFLHFPSKTALLHELDRDLARRVEQELAEPRGPAAAEYRTLVDRIVEARQVHGEVVGAMLQEILAARLEAVDGLRSLSVRVFVRGQERGEFRRALSPDLAADAFLACSTALLSGRDAPPDRARKELLQMLLHGIAEAKPRLKWSPSGQPDARSEGAA